MATTTLRPGSSRLLQPHHEDLDRRVDAPNATLSTHMERIVWSKVSFPGDQTHSCAGY